MSIRAVDSIGPYTISKVKLRRVDKFGHRIIWATVENGMESPPYVVGFCRNRKKVLLEEFTSIRAAIIWAKANPK
jgi:hypothetical protein